MNTLHITNGVLLNNYLKQLNNLDYVAFNEAFIAGPISEDIFSETFISNRLVHLSVSMEYYMENLKDFFEKTKIINEFDEIILYFGNDAFCACNMIVLLCYLEKLKYKSRIYLQLIDEENFSFLNFIEIDLLAYEVILKNILIDKNLNSKVPDFLISPINYYFDYINPNGMIKKIVNSYQIDNNLTLLEALKSRNKNYGLTNELLLALKD